MKDGTKWTLVTPDGRQLTARQHRDGWSVVSDGGETGVRSRLEVALMEAVLGDDSVSAHALRTDYAGWARRVTEEIERNERRAETIDDAAAHRGETRREQAQ